MPNDARTALTPLDILSRYWGYNAFRECQLEIIESVLAGHDTIGLLPTGGGKSITFQVPAMLLDGLTLVVTPLISLMKDQVDNLREAGIRAACLHSGMSRPERRLTEDRLNLGKIKILYISPEKLARKEFHADLRRWNVRLIVVDEAHCISQWGYDFRPSYLGIPVLRRLFHDAPVLALTATATPAVVADIADKLDMRPGYHTFSRSFTRPNISYIVRHDEDKPSRMLRVLLNTTGSAIVYARSRRRTVQLAQLLIDAGISADFYHAGLDTHDKTEKQDRWKNDEIRVMVATNAFGMGIDKPDVRVVIHYDLPPSLEEYYQEAGRAGRDGRESYAVLIAATPDKALLTRRLNDSFPGREYILMVYERVCNYLGVALGEGYDKVFEFNLTGFLATFGLKPAPTVAALQTLTRAGALEFDENFNSRSRISIVMQRHELYELDLDTLTDSVFQHILRRYTGLFADYVPIDEVSIAASVHCTPRQVYDSLLLLSRMKVISYIPRSNMPFIYFPTSRDLPRHVEIPRSVYEDLLERARKRMEAMRSYVFDNPRCRVQTMLAYFGEHDSAPCGKCDCCREISAGRRRRDTAASVDDAIDTLLAENDGVISLGRLRSAFPAHLDEALDNLRRRVDNGSMSVTGSEFRLS